MTYRLRLYPTESQRQMMVTHCQHARFVWNLALEQIDMYQPVFGKRITFIEQINQMASARQTFPWLAAGSATVQQSAIRDLERGFRNWWNNPGHFSRPNRRKRGRHEGFNVREFKIRRLSRKFAEVLIPKCGYVKFRLSRKLSDLDVCKSARVKMNSAGEWHVSFLGPQPVFEKCSTGRSVGIDLGLIETITLSTGHHLKMPSLLSPHASRRRLRLQRKMAKQKQGSNRRNSTRIKLARISITEIDRKKDWIEKVTTNLVRDYDFIVLEDLVIKKMVEKGPSKNKLNHDIHLASWGLIRKRIEDKAGAATTPCIVVRVNPAYTSQRCNKCDHIDKRNRENQAVFYCRKCGHTDNADVNASKNILAAGYAVPGCGDLQTLVGSTKRQSKLLNSASIGLNS